MSYRDPRTTYTDDDAVDVRRDEHGHVRDDRDTVVDRERAYERPSGREAAHERYGGMHVGAQLVGMLTAVAMTLLLAGLVAAAVGTVAFETGVDESLNATADEVSVGSVIAGIVVLAIAFVVGGWAAGRMSRYDGGRNGLMTAVWFLVLGAVLAGLGALAGDEYNVAARVDLLPDWFGTWFDADVAAGAIVSGLVAIVVILVAGFLGGKLGERFHRRADDMIARHESGAVVHERRVTR
ncbi:MAG TPA: hypothetical protein VLA82_05665 [Actinomycetota bacterium]|nr:hypothetical protein [Actinomycetota bacterium]